MDSTVVELKVISKKAKFTSPGYPQQREIELEVPYGQDNIYWKMSGGTNISLNTVNQDAAEMFILGGTVVMTLSPKQAEQPAIV